MPDPEKETHDPEDQVEEPAAEETEEPETHESEDTVEEPEAEGTGEPEAETEVAAEPAAEKPAEEVKTEEPKPRQPSNELKVVLVMKADNILIGVQSPDCDPFYKTMQGDLAAALQQVPLTVAEAKQKWEATPRYPKANLPTPPPTTPSAPRPATTKTTKKADTPKAQPSFF